MSAREWYICPFCKSNIQKAKEEYGKIPVEKFLEKYKDNLTEDDDPSEIETVRMDGEEWLDNDGNYKIQHSLNCNSCGRQWDIDVSITPIKGEGKSKLIFKVPSKSGSDDHEVEKNEDNYKCDCISFKTRKSCSHIDFIKKHLKEMEKEDE